jgi:hypothetical protein
MCFATNRMSEQFSRCAAHNTLIRLFRNRLILKILIVGLLLATSNVAHAQLYGGYGAWGNNVMSHYGGYGNRVMNYYGNTTVNPVRPLTPYGHRYYNGRGGYRQLLIINGRIYYGPYFSRRRF